MSVYIEICNGKDDDCDVEIDEDFIIDGIYLYFEYCGECG